MVKLIAVAGLVLGAVQWCAWEASPSFYTLNVVTSDGNEYEAGSGSTCASAWDHAVWPVGSERDWRSIRCIQIR